MPDDTTSDIELREGRWWVNADVDGKRQYGPYTLRETAEAVAAVLRRRMEASKAAASARTSL